MNNSKAASLAARLVENNHPGRLRHRDEEDDDDEALFAELEEEIENDTNASVREHGLQVLKAEMERMKHKKANHYGEYTEITDEKEVVQVSAREPRCVVHFYHTKFKRCEIMDKHLAKLAPKYTNTRFFRVFVENIPWLVEKLFIKVLPCVICFVDGIAKDRLVGFEELGNDDMFSTAVLELRLAQSNAIQKSSGNALEPLFKVSSSRRQEQKDDDDEFDM
ncbi:Thioredoxin domain-containing protein plp1 [Psilocybe cubensis]|uniref:Thioredoxin domain-containing protein plp1 n=1 Tax=Psilocybe cubensis TaxID=181762 RepID=A0ACB8H5X1_PSICU|nr:Thioredoxin domain-containing protein plp1 [Psilocybe cubensis]KAH9482584.1 Thioredoxin domain-containing protein plp1 [Psilocybe cubensis]